MAAPASPTPAPARGCAFGDFDNDGDMDVVVNCVNALPQLLRCDVATSQRRAANWIKIRTGRHQKQSHRHRRPHHRDRAERSSPAKPLRQIDEVRSGGSYYSQNDLRLHFGLDAATKPTWSRSPGRPERKTC